MTCSGEGVEAIVRDAATKLLAAVDTRNMRGRDHVPSMRDEQTARARMAKALALTPDATQTREAELAGFLEQVLLYADPSGDGLYDGAGDIAGVKQDGSLVLKGSFITICTRIRAALNARGGA